ncbi:hypothetical protein NUACC26_030470 [Scytonema sp. NUACC26]
MNKERNQAYLNLIQKLLESSLGEELEILNTHKSLVDTGLETTMKQVAATLAEQGDKDNALFLRNVAVTISAAMGQPSLAESYDQLMQMLLAANSNNTEPQVLHSILEVNLDKLDDKFPQFLKAWATNILAQEELIPKEVLASDIFNISNRMTEFSLGSQAINLEIALAGYGIAQTVFTTDTFPEEWVITQNCIASTYFRRIQGDKAKNFEMAITVLQAALQVSNQQTFPEQWVMTQNNLGSVYLKRINGDRSENLELAVTAFHAALQVCSKEKYSQKWANIQNNLATVYRGRIQGNKAENLELAMVTCQKALQVFTQEVFPQKWAETQNNLGKVYCCRIKGDRAENIELAILSHQAALKVFTLEYYSKDWAEAQNSLGLAYLERVRGDRAQNIELALAAFQAALQIFTQETCFEEWAMTQNNLGIAYLDRIYGNKAENLELSITALQAALQFRTQKNCPQDWARTQMNLGIAYGERIKGDREKNLELSITAFQASLQVYTKESFPEDRAITYTNLGHIHGLHGNIIESIKCFQVAVEFYQKNVLPLDCFWVGRNLGNTAFSFGLWKEAIEGYSIAIQAVETSRTWVVSESRRQEILEESINVYQNIVQACVNVGQLEKAVEYVERSRSKRLVDLMTSNDLYQNGEIPSALKELLQQYETLQQQIDQERSQNNSDKNQERMEVQSRINNHVAFQAKTQAIASFEVQKQDIWEQLGRLDPVLAGEIQVNAPNFLAIQNLIDLHTTAILSFYTTSNNTYIFVLRQNQITLHTCNGQGVNSLQKWIAQNWLIPYITDRNTWKSQVPEFLMELAKRLQIDQLISQHLKGIKELIIVPHLLLHQIPFTALPVDNQKYLGDQFLIRYTPSCQVLEFCQQRDATKMFHTTSLLFCTVEDAEDNLPCASFEGEQISQLCKIPKERRLIGSNQATRSNYRQLAQQVQVLHTCHHAESRLDNPLESQLKLGDGSITLGQLMSPGWRLPNLLDVFLSCCETNLGNPSLTDDVLTLSTGFLCAGA